MQSGSSVVTACRSNAETSSRSDGSSTRSCNVVFEAASDGESDMVTNDELELGQRVWLWLFAEKVGVMGGDVVEAIDDAREAMPGADVMWCC